MQPLERSLAAFSLMVITALPVVARDTMIDSDQAGLSGPWSVNTVTHPRIGDTYVQHGNAAKGECIARSALQLPQPGRYERRASGPPHPDRPTNVPRTIHDGGVIADAVQLLPVEQDAESSTPDDARRPDQQPLAGGNSVREADPHAPNILLLLADDLGYEALSCYGGQDFATPHLDRLASEGMRFSRAYTSPVCTPSRMSLYTGTYVSRHGYDHVLPVHLGTRQAVDFRNRWTTFPQLLRKAGYLTSVTGKWQLAALEFHPQHCRDAGFDSWCVWQIWRDGAKTTRYWNPCFNHDGHIRADIAEQFGPDVLADYVIGQMQFAVAAGHPFYIHHNMLLPHEPIIQTPAERRSGQPASLGRMIGYMDRLCGRIIQAVDELGIGDNTCVIVMGDNGTDSRTARQTSTGTVSGGKRDLNDAGTHVPLIVRHPGRVKAGAVVEDLVDMADWFPTICELAGVEIPADVAPDGVSFAGRLHDGERSRRQWVTGGIAGDVSVFDGEWRLNARSQRVTDARQLPHETVIASPQHEDIPNLQRLRAVATTLLSATSSPSK